MSKHKLSIGKDVHLLDMPTANSRRDSASSARSGGSARRVSQHRPSTILSVSDPDVKKCPSDEDDKIRFREENNPPDFPTSPVVAIPTAIPEQPIDETVRLFQSMPKGLEYFITTGPPKRVHDYGDYEKLTEAHARLKIELQVQKEPMLERMAILSEKKDHFLTAIQNFNHFLVDMARKQKRAESHFHRHRQDRKRFQKQMPLLRWRLAIVKKRQKDKRQQMKSIEKVVNFVDSIMRYPESTYRSFHDVMDRCNALIHTHQSQVQKYMENMEELESTREQYENYVVDSKENILRLRTELMDKKLELDRYVSLNAHLSNVVKYRQEQHMNKRAEYWRMTSGVNNMVNILMDYRPFTVGRLQNKTDTCSQIEAIGNIIADYRLILRQLREQYVARRDLTPTSVRFKLSSESMA